MSGASGFKTLGALFLIWVVLMLYFAVNVPHKEQDKRMEDELKALSSNIRKLQKENVDLRNQIEQLEDDLKDESGIGENIKDNIKAHDSLNPTLKSKIPRKEKKASPKSQQQQNNDENNHTNKNENENEKTENQNIPQPTTQLSEKNTLAATQTTTPKKSNKNKNKEKNDRCCKGIPIVEPFEGLDQSCSGPQFQPGRDYSKYPAVVQRFNDENPDVWKNCDIPCINTQRFTSNNGQIPDVLHGNGHPVCPQQKSVFWTMENTGFRNPSGGRDEIVSTTDLKSDVPVQYFNWEEYPWGRKVVPKTADAMAAAFISNCGGSERNQWINAMVNAGVSVDSYGGCVLGKQVTGPRGDYDHKMNVMSKYKFGMAMENSRGPDYVTEKLFQVLAAGAVPLHLGVPDVHKFGPAKKSIISIHDFKTPEEMAAYLIYLDKNETAYEEYLEWHKVGWSKRWHAFMDFSIPHSACRFCIRIGDLQRKHIGAAKGEPQPECLPSEYNLGVFIRPRGSFWLKKLFVAEKTVSSLYEAAKEMYAQNTTLELWEIQDLWTREAIRTDKQVEDLDCWHELQAIFVPRSHPYLRKDDGE